MAWLFGAICLLVLVSFVTETKWVKSVRRRLRENDGQFCLKCGYNLADSLDWGNCPECGVPYDIEAVREKWRAVVRYDHKQAGRRVELDE